MNCSFSIFGTGRVKSFKGLSSLARIHSESQRLELHANFSNVHSYIIFLALQAQSCHLLPHSHQAVKGSESSSLLSAVALFPMYF